VFARLAAMEQGRLGRRDSRYNEPQILKPQGEAELADQSARPSLGIRRATSTLSLSIAVLAIALVSLPAPRGMAQTASTPAKPATSSAKPIARPAQALGAPVKSYGSSNAPITMEVFTDYECPTCRNLFEQTLRPLISDYVAAGKVYLVHHDFPLPMHKYGYEAARWLNASARVGEFQNVEAALYDNQDHWAADGDIQKYVANAMSAAEYKKVEAQMARGCGYTPAGVKSAKFALGRPVAGDACALDTYIEADRALGNQIPVTGTPTYVISYKGKKYPAGSGLVPWPVLKQFFDTILTS
jgi:protein-disulfide isomerase